MKCALRAIEPIHRSFQIGCLFHLSWRYSSPFKALYRCNYILAAKLLPFAVHSIFGRVVCVSLKEHFSLILAPRSEMSFT